MRRLLITTVAASALLLTGCGAEDEKEFKTTDTSSSSKIVFPGDAYNVEYKCEGANMVYSSYVGLSVVPNDPRCTDGAR